MLDHELHGHQAVYFADEQKENQPHAVTGPLIFCRNEGVLKVKFNEKKQQGKADSTYYGCQ